LVIFNCHLSRLDLSQNNPRVEFVRERTIQRWFTSKELKKFAGTDGNIVDL
jgi:hypothetical protein